jgi:hypothetical protein
VSAHGLQRALVVALHDPAFVVAMHADPDAALGPFGLAPAERAQLLAVDRRAFGVDRLRARRLLRTLVEELKASVALALAETRSLAFLDGFVASPEFRRAIAGDGALVLSLGDYLAAARASGRLRTPALDGVLAIELGRARARRAARRSPAPGVALAPGVAVLEVAAGALEALQLVEQHLFEIGLMPHVALVDDRPALPALPVGEGGALRLLLRPLGDDVALIELEPPLHRALAGLFAAAAAGTLDRPAAIAALAALSLPVSSPALLLDQLIDDGLVSVAGG